jgi:Holliday junction resolvase RusA-like endonuclease
MNSLLINFEFNYLPPSVNKMYCYTRKGGLYLHPDVIAFKTNISNILKERKELAFIRSIKNIKLNITFYMKNRNNDIDGPIKVLLDAMNKIVYDDYKQIIELHINKVICKENRTVVDVYELE